jgi:IS30 family transposase
MRENSTRVFPHLFFVKKPAEKEAGRLSKRHLMLKDRMELERLYGIGFGAAEIATKLKVHRSTVYNELKRGDTGEMDENGRFGYSAELAQQRLLENYRQRRTARA